MRAAIVFLLGWNIGSAPAFAGVTLVRRNADPRKIDSGESRNPFSRSRANSYQLSTDRQVVDVLRQFRILRITPNHKCVALRLKLLDC